MKETREVEEKSNMRKKNTTRKKERRGGKLISPTGSFKRRSREEEEKKFVSRVDGRSRVKRDKPASGRTDEWAATAAAAAKSVERKSAEILKISW